jgi:hypothetical protein
MSIGKDFSSDFQIQWTNVVTKSYYSVEMTDLQISGTSLGLPSTAYSTPVCAVDSGTTSILFPQNVFNSIHTAFKNYCSTANLPGVCDITDSTRDIFNGYCYHMTAQQISEFPPIDIHISNVSPLRLTGQQYLVPVGFAWCLAIGNTGANGPTVLGDVFMQNWHVIFDRQNDRIGFADLSTCPAPGQLTQANYVVKSSNVGNRVSSEISPTEVHTNVIKSVGSFVHLGAAVIIATALFLCMF